MGREDSTGPVQRQERQAKISASVCIVSEEITAFEVTLICLFILKRHICIMIYSAFSDCLFWDCCENIKSGRTQEKKKEKL